MNLIGKIFTVLVFVMTLMFMAFAIAVYATHRNYRAEILRAPNEVQAGQQKGLKSQIEELNTRLKDLQLQKQQIETELASEKRLRQQMVAMLEAEMVDVRTRRDALIAEEQQLSRDIATAVENMRQTQDRIVQLQAMIDTLRTNVATTANDRDTSLAKVIELESQLGEALGQWDRLRKRNEGLAQDLGRYPSAEQPAAGEPRAAARRPAGPGFP